MLKSFKALFKVRQTYIGIGAAIAFQVIFFTVWMTAYDGVNGRTENLNVGVVNEDDIIGKEIEQQIQEHIPFKVELYVTMEQATSALNVRNIDMIIQIPKTFTASIQSGDQANIVYWINQSTATMTKSIMENTAVKINDTINQDLYSAQIEEVVTVMGEQLPQLPLPAELSGEMEASVMMSIQSLNDRPIEAEITKVNDVDEFSAKLIPLMIIISSFVGAMVMIMQHEEAVKLIKSNFSKWKLFFTRQVINVGVAFILPLLTIGLMVVFNIESNVHAATIYVFQSILYLAFLSFAQVFVLIFGNIGMVFNILALSLQLVTSGVLVPREMLSIFYNNVAQVLPATFGADGYYTIIFGGSTASIQANILSLLIIIGISLLISIGIVAIKRQNTETTVIH